MKLTSIGIGLIAVMALAGCDRSEKTKVSVAPAPAPAATTESTTTTAQTTTVTTAPTIREIALGRDLSPDKVIVEKTTTFAPSDTVYMTVMTEPVTVPSTMVARWTFEDGQVIEETRQVVQPAETGAVSSFHVTKPDGWPAGSYKVDIMVDGQVVETREFRVS